MTLYRIEFIGFVGCLPESDWLENTLDELDDDEYILKIPYHELSLRENVEGFFEKENITVLSKPLEWWREQPNITEPLSVHSYGYGSQTIYPYYHIILVEATLTYNVLSHYASYLINGDGSALTDWEIGEIDAAIDREEVDFSSASYDSEQGWGVCELTGGRGDLMTFTILLKDDN